MTVGQESDSWYDPGLNEREIEQIEMDTLRDAHEVLSKRKPHLRAYCRRVRRTIGASKGELCDAVYVTYGQEGGVHGFPIHEAGMRKKGVRA
jgi:hypothetical protein